MNKVLLVGNPNTGKTTLFNTLTKASEHTGNWHGVTVDSKSKNININNQNFSIVDLPGVYSLSPLSFEEQVTAEYVYNNQDSLVVNIVDVNNIYRNLYLTLDLISLGVNCILVINQTCKTNKNIYNINIKKLENILGIKVIKINAQNKKEINILKKEIYNLNNKKTIENKGNTAFLKNINEEINNVKKVIFENAKKININSNYLALKCLEKDEIIINKLNLSNSQKEQLLPLQNDYMLEQIAQEKYTYIDSAIKECTATTFNKNSSPKQVYGKNKLDKFVLNKFLCLPIFCLVLLCVFYLTFFSVGAWLGSKALYLFQDVFGGWLLGVVKSATSNPIIYDFFASSIIGGLGSVISFLPQVVMLFVCLGVLEDSGYLSRVAFCLDDIFSKIGLSGKSVYTLLMGFGCSTSACMTARTMEDKNAKIKTTMLAPYMSCSAKLPVYAVIGSAFFGANNVFVIFALYMLGVVVALLLSTFYEKTFLKSAKQSFILEFPPYRLVSVKRLLSIALLNMKQFLIRVGSLIVSVNVIIWILSNFSFTFAYVELQGGQSMLESLGKVFAPIFVPLGFGNWGAISALIAGLLAKEVIVSSIAMFNGISSSVANFNQSLSTSLTLATSVVFFSPASALSYMVFCLLYSPCFATIGVLFKEIGKKWTFVSIALQFAIAYAVSLVVYNSVNLIMQKGIGVYLLFALIFALCVYAVVFLIKKAIAKHKCKGCNSCHQ